MGLHGIAADAPNSVLSVFAVTSVHLFINCCIKSIQSSLSAHGRRKTARLLERVTARAHGDVENELLNLQLLHRVLLRVVPHRAPPAARGGPGQKAKAGQVGSAAVRAVRARVEAGDAAWGACGWRGRCGRRGRAISACGRRGRALTMSGRRRLRCRRRAAEKIDKMITNPALGGETEDRRREHDGRPVPRGVYRPQGLVSPLLRPNRATARPRQPMCA